VAVARQRPLAGFPALKRRGIAEYLRAMSRRSFREDACLVSVLMTAVAGYTAAANAQGPGATALAGSYVEAQEFGRRDESDEATRDYHRSVLMPQFSQAYRTHFRECTSSVPQPESTPFSFVAAIGADGRVLRLWSDRSTNVYQCVRGRLLFDRFPPPPREPFYLYIHMRFANPSSSEVTGHR
jgi:hypothetical protein